MNGNYKVIALIPAYNPNNLLEKLIDDLKEQFIDIIVIDDGSDKKSETIFNNIEMKSIVLHHKTNMGKGRALKTGLKYIIENYHQKYIVVTLDCDGQHKIEDVIKLIKYNIKHPEQFILGSRRFDKDVPLRSILGNVITRKIYRIVTGVNIYDTQTGLRSFSNLLINKLLGIKGERYEYEINVLLQLCKEKIPIKEITIETIYINNNSDSHFSPIKDSYKIYKEIIKFSLSSILSFFIDFFLFTIILFFTNSINYGLQIANIVARIISATINFIINKKYVFKTENNLTKAIISYTLLAISILIFNTLILSVLVEKLMLNKIIAKIITEVILFIISYIVQHSFVFKKNKSSK